MYTLTNATMASNFPVYQCLCKAVFDETGMVEHMAVCLLCAVRKVLDDGEATI